MEQRHVDHEIQRLFEGGLDVADTDTVYEHIRSCPTCAKQYEAFANAERALYGGQAAGTLSVASMDRVRERLLASSKPRTRSRRGWVLALGLLASAAAVVLVARAPDEHLATRGADAKLRADFAVRVLRVRTLSLEAVAVDDASVSPLHAGDALKVVYSTGPEAAWLQVAIVDDAGTMLHRSEAVRVQSDTVEARLAGTIDVPPTWVQTPLTVIVVFGEREDLAVWRPDLREPSDGSGVWVRMLTTARESTP